LAVLTPVPAVAFVTPLGNSTAFQNVRQAFAHLVALGFNV
jgi:hypothetical protein